MTRKHRGVLGQHEQLGPNAGEQGRQVAAHEVGAPDRSLEQHVSPQHKPITDETDMTR